jgi:putative peptide zinc metalloprotease protein
MNLSEALDAALPEIPKTRLARSRPPCLDPDLIVREDTMDGEPFFAILQRDKGNFFRFQPAQWRLATLFDGVRSFDEIADLYAEATGDALSARDVQTFAENMEDSGFWFKTPQEKNLAMNEKLMSQRERRAGRTSKINLAHIRFSAWDPDRYLTWLDRIAGDKIFSSWCVFAVVLLFLFETAIFISKWSILGPDIALYYNFAHKSLLDLIEFWLLFLLLGFIHESAHGLTCKHYGGQVHSMGLMLIFLMPAFYCDITEVWTSASKMQRLAAIIAGIWVEMVVCGIGMILWMNTLAGNWLHDFAYQLILITGIAVIIVNLNPLIKLDGYYFLTEAIGIPDLKERSTAFLSGWFQSRVLGLPVEMPSVARSRAPFFILYALASGAYSYLLLFVVVRLAYNIASNWMAELALIPAAWLGFVIFRSRLRSLRGVIKQLWLQNFGPGRRMRFKHFAIALLFAVILFVPFTRDREDAYYVIEPARIDTLHAAVPGRVDSVLVREGQTVRAGQPVLSMTSDTADSLRTAATAQTSDSRFDAFNAEIHGQSIAGAAASQDASRRSNGIAREAEVSLVLDAHMDATVLTHDPGSLAGQNVASGQALLQLAETGQPFARVYIPAIALDRIPLGAEVAFSLPDRFSIIRTVLPAPGGEAVTLPQGVVASQDYKGIKLPTFYATRVALPASAGNPPLGISGQAKIFGARRSLASRILIIGINLFKAHAW